MEMSHETLYLPRRPRRLRANNATRKMLQETQLRASQLIQPLFVVDEETAKVPVDSMPGVFRLGLKDLEEEAARLTDLGVRGIALFPGIDPAKKTPTGREAAVDAEGLVPRAVRRIKESGIAVNLIADLALDPYTSHGHDGVLDPKTGEILNDPTVEILAEMAAVYARAGVDWVAPSDMMDGRVGAIRERLDDEGFENTLILAYSAKFASAFYGPFRDAVGSRPAEGTPYLDKSSYQLGPSNAREAMVEVDLDIHEGADIVMVKPAGPYLDIIRRVRERCEIPVAAYQVSGEYAMIHAASANGWLDYRPVRDESLLAIRRAGADLILTYFAGEVAAEMCGA